MLKQTPPSRGSVEGTHRCKSGRVLSADLWSIFVNAFEILITNHLTGVIQYTHTRERAVSRDSITRKLRAVSAVPVLVLLGLGIGLLHPDSVSATPANTVNFQARLETAGGAIAIDGNYNVEFKLYSSSTGGSALWTEDYLVNGSNGIRTVNGYLTANLGSLTAFPGSINWGQQLYLTMNIGGTGTTPTWDGEMSPRLSLTSVPSAFALNSYNSATGFTGSLTVAQPTGGNQLFVVPDQGAAGSYSLLTTAAANNGYIQNQIASVQATSNFWISGTGKAATSLQSPSFDTPTSGTLSIGASTASAITIGRSGLLTTVSGSLTSSGLITANGGLTVAAGSTFTNASATLLTPVSVTITGGSLGSAATTVDVATTINVTVTGTNQTITIPSPTNTTAGRILYIANVGSNAFNIGGTTLSSHTATSLLWDGTTWTSASVFGSSNAYINNGTVLQGSASFNIDGSGQVGTSLTVGGLITANAGLTVKGTADSSAALTIRDSNGTTALEVRSGTAADKNLFIGIGSGSANISGSGQSNVALGYQALLSNSSGSNNTALGYQALQSNTSGGNNVAIGYKALGAATAANFSIAIGSQALAVSSSSGIAIGRLALSAQTSATGNVVIGNNAGSTITTGGNNTLIGSGAGGNLDSAANTAVGYNALANGTGLQNTALGTASQGGTGYTGSNNSSIGYNSLQFATTGSGNVALGNTALRNVAAGVNNVGVGNGSGINATGSNNVFLGNGSGSSATGSNNVFLGYNAGSNEIGDNKLYIANSTTSTPLIQGDFSASTLTVNGSGSVINKTASTAALSIKGAASQSADLLQYQDSNAIVLGGFTNAGALYTTSGGATLGALAAPTITLGAGNAGTAFYYAVASVSPAGITTVSNVIGTDANNATLNWTQITGATGYKVYRSTSNNFAVGTTVKLLSTISNGATTTYTDTGVNGSNNVLAQPAGTGLTIQAWNNQSGAPLKITSSTGSVLASVDAVGTATFSGSVVAAGGGVFNGALTTNYYLSSGSNTYTGQLGLAVGGGNGNFSFVTLQPTSAQTNNLTVNFPVDNANTTDTLCLQTLANCGGGTVGGTGTTNFVARFTGASALGNGLLYDSGTFGGYNLNAQLNGSSFGVVAASSSVALSVKGSGTDIVDFISSGGSVVSGINSSGQLYNKSGLYTGTLVQGGLSSANRTYTLPDESGTVCIIGGTTCNSGYIQNQGASAQAGSFSIQGTNTSLPTAVIKQAVGGASDIFQVLTNSNAKSLYVNQFGTASSAVGICVTISNTCPGALSSTAVNASLNALYASGANSATLPTAVLRTGFSTTQDILQVQGAYGDVGSAFDYAGNYNGYGVNTTLNAIVSPTPTISTGTSGSTYYYAIAAVNNNGVYAVPGTSVGLTSNNGISISWAAVNGAQSYRIYRSTANNFSVGAAVTLLSTVVATSTLSYADSATVGSAYTIVTTVGSGLNIQGWSGQTSNSVSVNATNSSGGIVQAFAVNGSNVYASQRLFVGSNSTYVTGPSSSNPVLSSSYSGTTNTGLLIKQSGAIGSNGDLIQFADTSNNLLTNFDQYGYLHVYRAVALTDNVITVRQSADNFDRFQIQVNGQLNFGSGATAPDITLSRSGAGTINTNASLILQNGAATRIGLQVRAASVQTSSLLEVQNNSGTAYAGFNSNGQFFQNSGNYAITLDTTTNAQGNALALKVPVNTNTSDTLCLQTLANCASNGANTTSTGTANYVARFTGTNALGTGLLYDNGSFAAVNTTTQIAGSSNTLNVLGGSGSVALAVQGSASQDIADFYTSTGSKNLYVAAGGRLNGLAGISTSISTNTTAQTVVVSATNTNTSSTLSTVSGLQVTVSGSANSSGAFNVNNALNLSNATAATGNTFNALYVGTGYNSLLNYGGASLISGTGLVQNAALDSTLNYSNLQNVTNLAASGNVSVTGTLAVTSNVTAGGTYNTNTFTSSALTFGAASAATISSAASQQLTLSSGSGTLGISATTNTLQRTAAGTTAIDLKDAANTTLQLWNSSTGVANLNLYGGSLTMGATPITRIDSNGNFFANNAVVSPTADSNNIFQVQNAASANAVAVDTGSTNYAQNGGAEVSGTFATNWTAYGTATITRDTSSFVAGVASAKAVTTAANSGAKNSLSATLTAGSTYLLNFSIKGSAASATMKAAYLYNGTTADTGTGYVNNCYTGSFSISTSYTKVTCTFTIGTSLAPTSGNSVAIYDSVSGKTFNIDNLSVNKQTTDGSLSVGQVRIGGIAGQGLTLLTVDTSAAAPTDNSVINSALYGSIYYDTSLGSLQCYGTSGWGACGVSPNIGVNLIPEYSGAVLDGSKWGSNKIGTMTSGLCSGTGRLNVNSSLCGNTDDYNYYAWTSPQATAQTYSIYVRYQLPATFKSFTSSAYPTLSGYSTSVATNTSGSAQTNGVQFSMYNAAGASCGSANPTQVTTTTGTWQTAAITPTSGGGSCTANSFNAGDVITFRIDVTANNSSSAYVSNLSFLTIGK